MEERREGAPGKRASLPVCLWGFISMSSLSEITRRVKRLGSLLTLLSLHVALPLVTLFAPCTEHLLQQGQAMAGFPLVLLRKVRRWSKCPSRLTRCGVRLSQPSRQCSPCLDLFSFIAQRYLKVSSVAASTVFALPRSTCLPAGRFSPISLLLLRGSRGLGRVWEPSGWEEPLHGAASQPQCCQPRGGENSG